MQCVVGVGGVTVMDILETEGPECGGIDEDEGR